MEQGSRLFYQCCTRDALGEHVGVLIHGQDGHPVCCIGGHTHGAIELPDRIGEGASTRHDENVMLTPGRPYRTADLIQRPGNRREPSTDLDYAELAGG
jgi:hypothetical protein